jgi:hypothetical protein
MIVPVVVASIRGEKVISAINQFSLTASSCSCTRCLRKTEQTSACSFVIPILTPAALASALPNDLQE